MIITFFFPFKHKLAPLRLVLELVAGAGNCGNCMRGNNIKFKFKKVQFVSKPNVFSFIHYEIIFRHSNCIFSYDTLNSIKNSTVEPPPVVSAFVCNKHFF